MNGRLTTTKFGSMWGDKLPVLEYVYGIIDSKIDYIELRTRNILEKFKNPTIGGSHRSDSIESFPSTTDLTVDKLSNDELFEHFERLSQSIYLLGQLKHSLTEDNAFAVIQLLNDDNYLKMNELQLNEILSVKTAA